MIYRIDVRPKVRDAAAVSSAGNGHSQHIIPDATGESVRQQIRDLGFEVGPIATSRIFLLDTDAAAEQVVRIASELLADVVVESAEVVERSSNHADSAGVSRIEVHLKPGVMDPVADSTEMAIRDMGLNVREVRTGRAYLIDGQIDIPQ